MREFVIKADESLEDIEIRDFLKNRLKMSTGLITDLKKGEYILKNEVRCTVREKIKHGDTLRFILPPEENTSIIPVEGKIDILYEDEEVIAVNKPADMPTHPSFYHPEDTLANRVCFYFGKDFVFRAVTRLDRCTSGVVLIGKNRYSAECLNRQMRAGAIKKKYLAVCSGVIEKSGTVEIGIKREEDNAIRRTAVADGQYAKTYYEPLRVLDNMTLVRLYPETGRTHQLRVHMAYIGHPLVGDFLYGTEIEGMRTLLHCEEIEFGMPLGGKRIRVAAPVPKDFTALGF